MPEPSQDAIAGGYSAGAYGSVQRGFSKTSSVGAFIRRTHARLPDGLAFKVVVDVISAFLVPPLMAAVKPETFLLKWQKDGPWTLVPEMGLEPIRGNNPSPDFKSVDTE
jgi:hypothetical protein